MSKEIPDFVDLVAEVGPAPDGVDQIDYIIASLPAKELTTAANNSTFSYEGLRSLINKYPGFLERYDAVPHPEKTLADEILVRQQRLSRTRRRFATFATALALGSGGFAFGYKSDVQVQHDVFGKNHPVETSEAWRDGLIFGGMAGFLGGAVAGFAGLSMSGRLARRPAQKIVDTARASHR